jgi:predicted secreted hydrolase
MIQLTRTIGLGLNLGLILMLSACSEPQTSHQSISMGKLMGPAQKNDQTEDDATYTQVDKNRAIVFPQDHLSHPDFRQEWWYLTANLETAQGEKLRLQ